MRNALIALLATAATAAPGRADIVPVVVGAPASYAPNPAFFEFELRAPGLNAFTAFNLDLLIDTISPDPDTLLTVTVSRPGDASYAFGAAGTFTTGQTPANGGTEFAVNIAGSVGGPGVATVAGVNDVLAVVRVTPGVGLNEPITFQFDAGTYRIDALSENNQPLQPADPFTVSPEPTNTPVPAPAGAALLAVGGVALALKRRK